MSSDTQDVNLDVLYQHILLTEQQASENTRRLHGVKSAITKVREEIKCFTEKLDLAHTELDEKAQLESEMMLQLNVIKRKQEEIQKKKEELLEEQNGLRQEMVRITREEAEEKEKFMQAIRSFNSEFNLLRKTDVMFQSQTKSEIERLESEAEALNKEMELMKQENSQLICLRKERESLAAELQELMSHLAELERELEEAVALTESLKAEKELAIQKPHTDSTCLRLKKELEAHKELEMLHEALSTEIQCLRSKLSQEPSTC